MTFDRISADPGRMGGLPTIRDTRVTVTAVLGQLAAGRTPREIVTDYPYLELDDVYQALAFASEAPTHVVDHGLVTASWRCARAT